MKQLVKEVPTVIVAPVSEIKDSDIVCVYYAHVNQKCFVMTDKDGFIGIDANAESTQPKSSWEKGTKKEYVESALAQNESVKAYIFNTIGEAFKWMLETE